MTPRTTTTRLGREEEQLDLDGMDFQPADFDQQGEEEAGETDLDGMTFRPQGGHYHGRPAIVTRSRSEEQKRSGHK